MLNRTEIPLLAAELAELDKMLGEVKPGSISARLTLQSRRRVVEQRLQELREQPDTAAFVQLLFTGNPVLDSRAIDAAFAADAIQVYQDILTKATAVRRGSLGRRGMIAGATTEQSRFYLTGVARGSFGFVLEESPQAASSLFDTSLKSMVREVSQTMSKFSSLSEDDYSRFIQDLDKRLFSSFKSFFKLLHEAGAQMKIVESDERVSFDEGLIQRAYSRVEATTVDEEEFDVDGILLGLTPLGGNFDFLSTGQSTYSGKFSSAFTADYRNQVDQGEFMQPGQRYRATLLKRTTRRGTNTPHVSYFLLNLVLLSTSIDQDAPAPASSPSQEDYVVDVPLPGEDDEDQSGDEDQDEDIDRHQSAGI